MRVYAPPATPVVLAALAALAATILAAVLGVKAGVPPAALPADAPAEAFSAERAMRDVEAISRAPHPLGSAEHARVREYLVVRLEELGLEVEVQRQTVVERFPRYVVAAGVHNIVARRPADRTGQSTTSGGGQSPGDAILLAAHYDTRPTTPGAGDDSSGVAVILELLRALEVDGDLERDVIVLLSDGEELGLLGARAFVERHRWARSIGWVMNFEARGNRGAAIMFETGAGNRRLVEAFADTAPYPTASSLTFDVYQRMPNDTDFTVFREAGWTGYNFAFIEGYPAYHTALDRPGELAAESLQQEGSNALALLRGLHGAEVALDDETAIYFNPFGHVFFVYSNATATALVVVALAGTLVVAFFGRRRGWLSAGGLLHVLLLWVLVLVAAAVGGMAAWLLFRQLAPHLEAVPHGFHYASLGAFLALVSIAAGLASFLSGRQLGPRSLFEIGFGVAVAWELLAIFTLVELTGGSYLFVWPLLALLVGLAATLALERADPSSARVALALGAAAIPAALLIAPVATLMLHALTLQLAIVLLAITAIGLSPLLPHLAILARRWRAAWVSGLLLAGIAVLGWIAWTSDLGRDTPRIDHLFYVADGGLGDAAWWSFDPDVDVWTDELLDEEEDRRVLPAFLPLAEGARGLSGRAPLLGVDPPTVEVLKDDRAGGGRQVEVLLRSRRGAGNLHFRAEAAVSIERVSVGGEPVDVGDGLAQLRLVYFGAPEEGVHVEIDLPGRWPVDALVGDQSYGLAPTGVAARPEGLIPGTSWWTDSVFVVSESLF